MGKFLTVIILGWSITIAIGIYCGIILEHSSLSMAGRAGLITLIGLYGRTLTDWILFKLNIN